MDPDALPREIPAIVLTFGTSTEPNEVLGFELAEKVKEHHEWLLKGDYPPQEWQQRTGVQIGDRNAEFRRLWPKHKVHQRTHPLVGDFTVTFQAFNPAGDPNQTV
jgi:hypothetical protein